MKIGVIGGGFVVHAMSLLSPGVDVMTWDIDPNKRVPSDIEFDDFTAKSELIFVAVPTPMNHDGSCHTGIVEQVVQQVQAKDRNKHIILRSTVPPGTSKKLNVSFMPEFLTEKNWKHDFINSDKWIIGTGNEQAAKLVKKMFTAAVNAGCVVSDHVEQTTSTEAEMIKYTKNCFLASKVSFFNEIYQLCKKLDIDYETVRHFTTRDDRIGPGHTQVPGHDGSFGYGGTCFPKDTNALKCIMKQHNVSSPVIDSVVFRNETIDRPGKDWNNDKGRAVL